MFPSDVANMQHYIPFIIQLHLHLPFNYLTKKGLLGAIFLNGLIFSFLGENSLAMFIALFCFFFCNIFSKQEIHFHAFLKLFVLHNSNES